MKWIKYNVYQSTINKGTEESPSYEDILLGKKVGYSEENLAIAQKEAYNGEYTIEEDDKYLNVGVYTSWSFTSYLTFVGNVNAEMVSAAFGKGNETCMKGLGAALVMYSRYKGEDLEFKALFDCDTLDDISKSPDAIAEVLNSSAIVSLMQSNDYAFPYISLWRLNAVLPEEHRGNSFAEIVQNVDAMGYMHVNYKAIEALNIFSNAAITKIILPYCVDTGDVGIQYNGGGTVYAKKCLVVRISVTTNISLGSNFLRQYNYRPDGTTQFSHLDTGIFANSVIKVYTGKDFSSVEQHRAFVIPCEA